MDWGVGAAFFFFPERTRSSCPHSPGLQGCASCGGGWNCGGGGAASGIPGGGEGGGGGSICPGVTHTEKLGSNGHVSIVI